MRRARMRQRAQKSDMQQQIRRLEAQLAGLVDATRDSSSGSYGRLLLQTERLWEQKRQLEGTLQQFEVFRSKLDAETQEETERWRRLARPHHAAANRSSTVQSSEEEVPAGRPEWMSGSAAQQLIQAATDMFVTNAERTDVVVPTANAVLGWRDKRAVVDDTWALFLLTKDFPHQSAESLVERTWNATVNVDKLRGMLKWPAGMNVRHRPSDDAVVVCRELHLPNAEDAEHPICYRYQLIIFRAETPNGFIISTQNIDLSRGPDASAHQMLDQQSLRSAGVPLVTVYGFQFERQYCETTGEEIGWRVKLSGRTSDGSLSDAHNMLTEALPSILRWENAYVGPILCITSST